MADLAFVVGDGATAPKVLIEITDLGGGNIRFDLSQDLNPGNLVGDLTGLFFHVANDANLNLTASGPGVVTNFAYAKDAVTNLGGGNNVNSLGPYDFGVSIGTSGLKGGADDFLSASFTVSGAGLTFHDFENQEFAVRLQSVGTVETVNWDTGQVTFVDCEREGSAKVAGFEPDNCPKPDYPDYAAMAAEYSSLNGGWFF